MRDAPASSREELVAAGAEFAQILQVPAPSSLVDGRVQLEADHIAPICEPGDDAAVAVSLEPSEEAVR